MKSVVVVVAALALSGCAGESRSTGEALGPTKSVLYSTRMSEPTMPTTAPPTTAPPPTVSTAPPTTAPPPTSPPAPPAFSAQVKVIDDAIAARMTKSWRPGCPVPLRDLRLIEMTYWGYDDKAHTGELVVGARYADDVAWVFEQLYNDRFPIQRMEIVDVYDADDDKSMVANNTSAFNCREVAGRPGVLSFHSFGSAIDINPLINPWVRASQVIPPEGAPYADRSVRHKGGIYRGDVVTRSFAAIGWGWGGDWPDSKDWQHFSASGR